jgi:hypothetical protein
MEWLLVAFAFMVFIVVPPCIIVDMIWNPEQFGPPGPNGYNSDQARIAANNFLSSVGLGAS